MKPFALGGPTLALTKRALRLDARSLPSASLRMALVALMMLTVAMALATSVVLSAPGRQMFQTIAVMNVLFVLLVGISTFAGVITEEKEHRTLGLLRLAGFSPLAILLGKSAGALLSAMLLLAVQVPFAMLSVTLGGVAASQVLAAYAMLATFLLLVYAVSLLFSVVAVRTQTAGGLAAFVIVASWIVPPSWLALTGDPAARGGSPDGVIGRIAWEIQKRSVWSGLGDAHAIGSTFTVVQAAVLAHVIAAIAVFVLAWLSFDRFNQREADPAQSRALITIRTRRSRSRPPAGPAAFFWKAYHFDAGGRVGVYVRVAVYALAFLVVWNVASVPAGARPGVLAVVGGSFAGLCLFLLALEFGNAAAQIFHGEVQWKTLPSLMITPYPIRSWAYRKTSGFLASLIPGMVAFVIAVVMALTDPTILRPELFVGGSIVFANILLGSHVAAYLSLTMRRGAFAMAVTVILGINFIWFSSVMGAGAGLGGLTLWVFVLLGLTAAMHHAIGQKIRQVAGQ